MASALDTADLQRLRELATQARAMARVPRGRGREAEAVTLGFRATVARMLHDQSPYLEVALAQVREESPVMYLKLVADLAEYVAPKLARTEILRDDDGPLSIQIVQVQALPPPAGALVSSPVIEPPPGPPPPVVVEVVLP